MLNVLLPIIGSIIDKVVPDPKASTEAKLKALELAQTGELAHMEAEVRLALGQLKVNEIEASTDLFRGGWRPFIGWVCGLGFACQMILAPFLTWICLLFEVNVPFPELDMTTMGAMLSGMLGLGYYRTQEKMVGKG